VFPLHNGIGTVAKRVDHIPKTAGAINMNQDRKPPDPIVIPSAVDEVIQGFERAGEPFTVRAVQQALSNTRRAMEGAGEAESFAVWSEVLAFALIANGTGASP
jgi:hypothetical protein